MATQRLYALFQDVADAERAIGALQDHGISRENIGIVARRPAEEDEAARVREGYARLSDHRDIVPGQPEAAYQVRPGVLPPAALAGTVTPASTADTPQNVEAVGKEGITTTTPQDAAAGAAIGGGVGLVAGLLAAAAALTIPGFGIVLSGGILASALGAAVATTAAGAAVGGVVGYLTDMGMPQQAAANYADRLREGDYLLTVVADSLRYDELKQLLMKYNAAGVDVTVNEAGQQIAQAWGNDVVDAERLRLADTRPIIAPVAPVAAGAATYETAPVAGARVITEAADGTPIIPAQVVQTESLPYVGETPDETAARLERERSIQR